jgi:serine protease Do
MLKTSAATGNTAGSLWGNFGQVVGIISPRISLFLHDSEEETAFVIPSITVKQIVDQLIAHGYVSGRPTLGLSGDTVTAFDQAYFHIPQGLYLSAVEPDSDAFRLGIEPGDILVSLGGEIITSQPQLDTLVNSMTIGDEITAVFFRAGEELTVTLTVTEYTG